MASVGHLIVGAACGRACARKEASFLEQALAQGLMMAVAVAADLDVAGYLHGVPYGSEFGHRGAAHSLLAALLLALAAAGLAKWLTVWPLRKCLLCALLAAVSHPLLDALTTGGRGIAFFWPLGDHRYFFPWRPIPVAPLGRALFTWRGIDLMAREFAGFLPLAVYAWFPRGWFRK